jgi:hypothetical protein
LDLARDVLGLVKLIALERQTFVRSPGVLLNRPRIIGRHGNAPSTEPASVFFGTGKLFLFLHVLGFVHVEKSNPKLSG